MRRLSILMYHRVGRFRPMKVHRANYCDHRRFAAQMAFLRHFNFQVLSLDQALAGLRGLQPLPKRALVLTFDDGYDDFMTYAAPVLADHGFPATVYAISGALGQQPRWLQEAAGQPPARLMTPQQLRSLRAQGIGIGSHTASHLELRSAEPRHIRDELRTSKQQLEDLLGEPVEHLCYPFGGFNLTAVKIAAAVGYKSATTCLRGAATPADHPLILPRKAISFGDDLIGFWWKLAIKQAPKPRLSEWRQRWAAEPEAFAPAGD